MKTEQQKNTSQSKQRILSLKFFQGCFELLPTEPLLLSTLVKTQALSLYQILVLRMPPFHILV